MPVSCSLFVTCYGVLHAHAIGKISKNIEWKQIFNYLFIQPAFYCYSSFLTYYKKYSILLVFFIAAREIPTIMVRF